MDEKVQVLQQSQAQLQGVLQQLQTVLQQHQLLNKNAAELQAMQQQLLNQQAGQLQQQTAALQAIVIIQQQQQHALLLQNQQLEILMKWEERLHRQQWSLVKYRELLPRVGQDQQPEQLSSIPEERGDGQPS